MVLDHNFILVPEQVFYEAHLRPDRQASFVVQRDRHVFPTVLIRHDAKELVALWPRHDEGAVVAAAGVTAKAACADTVFLDKFTWSLSHDLTSCRSMTNPARS